MSYDSFSGEGDAAAHHADAMTDARRDVAERLKEEAEFWLGLENRSEMYVNEDEVRLIVDLLRSEGREPDAWQDLHPHLSRCYCGAVLGRDPKYTQDGERHHCPLNKPENLRTPSDSPAGEAEWLEHLSVLRLEPGDTVVLRTSALLAETDAARMRQIMEEHFPGHRCIVLEDGLELGVVRRKPAE